MRKENLDFIYGLKLLGIKQGLKSTRNFMNLLGNPQDSFEIVHIAGTNGKGSTSTMVANILKEAGYKVGLYLSPYVINFNERIQINSKPISDKRLDSLITKLRKIIKKNSQEITFFEFITALAFMYFAEQKIDIAIVEVGLGGRLDATNITNSLIAAITNIGIDHTDLLGKTKQKIAKEKAGIIKENQTFITSEEDSTILNYFKKICKEKNSKFIYVKDQVNATLIKQNLNYQRFSTQGAFNETFTLSLLGKHQVKNACLALTIINELKKQGKDIPISTIKKGLGQTVLPGRLQIFSKNPLIILDGAHNPQGMQALKEFISPMKNKKTLVIGTKDNKDSEEIIKLIVPLFKNIIITKGRFRPKDPEVIAKEAKKYNENITVIPDAADAIRQAKKTTKGNEIILITGSLYLVSDALKILKN